MLIRNVNPFMKSKQETVYKEQTLEPNKIYLHQNDPFTLMLSLLGYFIACCTCVFHLVRIIKENPPVTTHSMSRGSLNH